MPVYLPAVQVSKLAVLADGMGGHRAGDIASQMAVTNLGEAWEKQEAVDDEKSPNGSFNRFKKKIC